MARHTRARPHDRRGRLAARLALAVVGLALSQHALPHGTLERGTVFGQTPPAASKTRAAAGAAVPRLTREELIRKFDLNRDGKIDQGELEVASSKMRLERAEMRLSRGVDPVTGLPRDAQEGGLEPDEAEEPPLSIEELARRLGLEPAPQETPPAAPPPPADGERPLQPRIFGLTPPSQSAAAATEPGSRAALPGGVRAGGRPALPGYGSGVRPPSLNAGRADQLPPVTTERQRVGGGLMPRLEPTRPAPPRPQRTVEDFNVY
jgi:hypothetical protein